MNGDALRARQHAFTLIEMLAALSILGVLVALLLPVAIRLKKNAETVACAASMRQVYTALLSYRADHDGWFPGGRYFYSDPTLGGYSGVIKPALLGQDYLHDTKPFIPAGYLNDMPICPAAHLLPQAKDQYPDEKRRIKQLGCYSINAFVLNNRLEGLESSFYLRTLGVGYPPGRFAYPGSSRIVMLTESCALAATYVWSHIDNVLDGYPQAPSRLTAPRDHGNLRLNWMFVDGHMELLGAKKVNGKNDWSEHFSTYGEEGKRMQPLFMPDSLKGKSF